MRHRCTHCGADCNGEQLGLVRRWLRRLEPHLSGLQHCGIFPCQRLASWQIVTEWATKPGVVSRYARCTEHARAAARRMKLEAEGL